MNRKIYILGTGGTIAGVGEPGKITGYHSGQMSVADLLKGLPQLPDDLDVEAIQVCNLNSDDIGEKEWLELTRRINTLAEDPAVAGFVITHGTDTLEETAYFLQLTVKTEKPVVLTGSMRPATAVSADGAMNIYQCIVTVLEPESIGKGVLIAFADQVFSARDLCKSSTYTLTAMSGGDMGCLGIIRDDKVTYYSAPLRKHTIRTVFDVSKIDCLPKVSILYFHADADVELLKFAIEHSDGLVIAGAGTAEMSLPWYAELERHPDFPVVYASRIQSSSIIPPDIAEITADTLQPYKAAVLLRLALTVTHEHRKIANYFSQY